MLIGPSTRPTLPELPSESEGIRGIIRYLRDLEFSVNSFVSAIVVNSVALAGVRGISSSGIVPKNFVAQAVDFSNRTTGLWVFDAPESDVSYMLIFSPNSTASFALINITRFSTGVIFQIANTGISGLKLDCLLLR